MTKAEKHNLETMLSGFESALEEFDAQDSSASLSDLMDRIQQMDSELASIPFIIEA